MELKRIDSDRNIDKDVYHIEFKHLGNTYIITPDKRGFRIHKRFMDSDCVWMHPAFSNGIIIN